MKIKVRTAMGLLLFSFGLSAQNNVYVNDQKVPFETIQTIENSYGISIEDGNYWYDSQCGAWGLAQGPTLGFIPAGLNVGGKLKANASNGRSNVFVNGRELPMADVVALQRIVHVVPGRFWMDNRGNVGYEGYPSSFNLVSLARQKGGSSFYRNSYTGIGAGSSGGTSYVMGKNWSVIID